MWIFNDSLQLLSNTLPILNKQFTNFLKSQIYENRITITLVYIITIGYVELCGVKFTTKNDRELIFLQEQFLKNFQVGNCS